MKRDFSKIGKSNVQIQVVFFKNRKAECTDTGGVFLKSGKTDDAM